MGSEIGTCRGDGGGDVEAMDVYWPRVYYGRGYLRRELSVMLGLTVDVKRFNNAIVTS